MRLRIVTRKSPLALKQTELALRKMVKANPGAQLDVIPFASAGDKRQEAQPIITPGIFTKELENHLLANQSDLAVHSLKDMPTTLDHRLKIMAVLKRESFRDVMVFLKKNLGLWEEKKGIVGTSSVRRTFYLKKKFPDFSFKPITGNINTRLLKLEKKECDFLIMSEVGLKRLNLFPFNMVVKKIPLNWFLPAPAQGVIALEGLKKNKKLNAWLRKVNHLPTEECVSLERRIMKKLQAGCNSPLGCLVEKKEDIFAIRINWVLNFTPKEAKHPSLKTINITKKLKREEINKFLQSLKKYC